MSATRFTKTGQPVQGTTMEADIVSESGDIDGWTRVRIVGKLFGRGGQSDLIGVICELDDGSRLRIPWPHDALRAVAS